MAEPLVSVVMPVYNNATTVVAAARSILTQSIQDLELIIVDDGSRDGSADAVNTLRDSRIRLLQNETNGGVAVARNRGLEVLRGRFMAPMDADDVCRPYRLARTLRVLEANPGIVACGGRALWKGWGSIPFVGRLPWGPDAVRAYMLFGMPSPHDALLFRSSVVREHGVRYPVNQRAADDYTFYRQCARHGGVDNVADVLVEYRCNRMGISNTRATEATARRLDGLRDELSGLLPETFTEQTLRFHAKVGNGTGVSTVEELNASRLWLETLERANLERRVYAPNGLALATAMVWFSICRNSAHLGVSAWRAWRHSVWAKCYCPDVSEYVGFFGSWALGRVLPSRRHAQGALDGL